MKNRFLNANENELLTICIKTIESNDSSCYENIPADESDLSWFDTASLIELAKWLLNEYSYFVDNANTLALDDEALDCIFLLGITVCVKSLIKSYTRMYDLCSKGINAITTD